MKVFGIIGSNEPETLTEENYCEKTNKNAPYYRPDISKKSPYFALCPECGNPIQVVNLYTDIVEEKVTGRKGLHAKHYTHSIPKLAVFNNAKFQKCSLKAKTPLGYKLVRKDKTENERLKKIVENNRKKIRDYIRQITNIFFTNAVIDGWIDDYLLNRKYEYKGVDERNIPYSILVSHQAIDIYGQKLSDADLGAEIRQTINVKSKFFKVESEEGKIVKKIDKKFYPYIKIVIYGHKIVDEEETIKLKIFEYLDDKEKKILSKELDVLDCPL